MSCILERMGIMRTVIRGCLFPDMILIFFQETLLTVLYSRDLSEVQERFLFWFTQSLNAQVDNPPRIPNQSEVCDIRTKW